MIKFVLTKNPELLFKSETKAKPKPKNKAYSEIHNVNSRSFNVDIQHHRSTTDQIDFSSQNGLEVVENSDADFVKELESHYTSQIKLQDEIKTKTPITIAERANEENKIEIEDQDNDRIATETPLDIDHSASSKTSLKPAKVVFKKSSADPVSRAERANKMAHFEYIESGLNNVPDDMRTRENKFKMNSRLYNMANRDNSNTVSGFGSKFSPKRFRRFPRFTIFLNKDQESLYEKENSISLNPQFLNFLMTPERAEIVDKGKI